MAGLDLSSLSGLAGNLGALVPSSEQVIQNMAVGLAGSVALAGLKAKLGDGTIPDPLHLHGQTQQAPVAPTNNPNVIVGPTITASAFAAIPAAAQQQLIASGVHIVAG